MKRLERIAQALHARCVDHATGLYDKAIVIELSGSYTCVEVSVPDEHDNILEKLCEFYSDFEYEAARDDGNRIFRAANCAYVRMDHEDEAVFIARDLREITLLPINVVIR